MSGSTIGGKKAAATNKQKYGSDFYSKIGAKGGKLGTTGGFAAGEAGRKRASYYGRVGGKKGSRLGVKNKASAAAISWYSQDMSLSEPFILERKPSILTRIFKRRKV